MTANRTTVDVVRQRADWMRPVDERIMETMRDEGNLTPQAVENFNVCSRSHASVRLSKLNKYGLVDRIAQGLYRLNENGRAFLDEELDASELELIEDTE